MSETVQSIVEFLESKARATLVTNSEYQELITELRQKINELSVAVPGLSSEASTVLYSGWIKHGELHSGASTQSLAESNSGLIRTINQTEVYDLLDSENVDFHDALQRALGPDSPESVALYNDLINGSVVDGVRVPDSLWDDASKRFAESAAGNVKLVAPNADATRVFSQTELPALMANPSVTSIDGVPMDELFKIRDNGGLDAVFKHVRNNSLLQVELSGLSAGNYDSYLTLTPDDYASAIHNDPSKLQSIIEKLNGLDVAEEGRGAEFETWYKSINSISVDLSRAGNVLNKLGYVGAIGGFLFVSSQSYAAEQAGDHEGAVQIMEEYAVDSAGSLIGETVGAAIGGIAVAAIAAAGVTVSLPVAAVVVIGASVAGGFFGADTAVEYYDDFVGKSEGEKRTLVQSVSDWIFGDATTPEEIISKIPTEGAPQLEYISLSPEYTTVELDPTPTLSSEEFSFYVNDLVAGAKSDMAIRHALKELSPFAILNADIDQHNTSGELDLYDPETGTGTMTEEWIEARSLALLFRNIQNDGVDINGLTEDSYTIVIHHEEGELEIITTTGVLGGEPKGIYFGNEMDETFAGGANDDLFFGEGGADTFDGKDGHDKLYGGKGNDHLTGGKDRDFLDGGEGDDTYYYNIGDGNDTIRDEIGNNKLVINGQTITTLTQVSADTNAYKDDQDNTYVLTDSGDMVITVSDGTQSGTITLNWFDKGTNNFGLVLNEPPTPEEPELPTGLYTVGDGSIAEGASVGTIKNKWEARDGHTYQGFINDVGVDVDTSLITELWNYDAATDRNGDPLAFATNSDDETSYDFYFEGSDQKDVLTGGYQGEILYGRDSKKGVRSIF